VEITLRQEQDKKKRDYPYYFYPMPTPKVGVSVKESSSLPELWYDGGDSSRGEKPQDGEFIALQDKSDFIRKRYRISCLASGQSSKFLVDRVNRGLDFQ
jgi:hypothetical protein